MKKILVTGGAGFIGSHIVDLLIQKKYRVIVVDNLSTGKKKFINPSAKFYKANITSRKKIFDIFAKEKPDMVIHVAAQVMLRKSIEQPIHDAQINILGTLVILEACRKFKVKKIIYTSTGGARIGEPQYLPVDEKHPLKPCSPYGISKHSAEHYVEAYGDLYNLNYLIFCFGNVYGPRDDPKCKRVTSFFAYLMLHGKTPKIFGDGKQTRDFLYVIDLAKFIVKNINKNPKHKLFHLANSKQISVNQIYKLLQKAIGFKKPAKHIAAIKGEVRDIRLDTKLAKKELGWRPRHTFEQGLTQTVEWLKKNKL